MKKIFTTFLFSLLAMIACAFTVGANELTTSAANDFSVSVTELDGNEGMYARSGDFKVTVSVANYSVFQGGSICIKYDSANYLVVAYLEDGISQVEYTSPSEWGMTFVLGNDPDQSLLAISFATGTPKSCNGELISFYLRPKNANAPTTPLTEFTVLQLFENSFRDEAPYTEPTSYVCSYISTSYVIGDVDGDGIIDSADAIIVMEVVEVDGNRITLAEFNANDPFADYDDVVCIGVVDVDGDNDVDNVDAQKILEYYSTVGILGGTYNGVIGTTGYYYTVVESFNSTNQ